MKNVYTSLEEEMVQYNDLIAIPVLENNEPFVIVPQSIIPNKYMPGMMDMHDVFGEELLVRTSVYNKLCLAQTMLRNHYPSLSLFLTYGYRSLEVQTTRFLDRLKYGVEQFYADPIELYEEIHRSIAVPTVAGHPTGGALDITIIDTVTNDFIDFGSRQYDYATKDYYVFSPNISDAARRNRMLLRAVMVQSGFAPFDGEWWHFSYGDREWAYYYKKENALYEQKSTNYVKEYYEKKNNN